MTSTYNQDLVSERVQSPSGIDFDDIQCCICSNILWKPVACQSCETPFCSTCIAKWVARKPRKCPINCNEYLERSCPRFILKQLAKLQIDCIYKLNGCNEIVSYEALEKHEVQCDYQTQERSGCQLQIIKKDFNSHEAQCESIELTCPECKLIFTRGNIDQRHTDVICLKEQLRQLRLDSEENKRELRKLRQDNDKQTKQIKKIGEVLLLQHITFADIHIADDCVKPLENYKYLEWTDFKCFSKSQIKNGYPFHIDEIIFTNNNSDVFAYCNANGKISAKHLDMLFDVVSLDVCGVCRHNQQLTIIGYRDSIQVNIYTTPLVLGKIQHIDLQWTDIDELKFCSSGGTTSSRYYAHESWQLFTLTDLILNRSF